MKREMKALLLMLVLGLSLFAIWSCTRESREEDERLTRVLFLEMEQEVIVPTSVVRIVLRGTERVLAGEASLEIKGEIGGREVLERLEMETEREGDVGNLYLDLAVEDQLWSRLSPGDNALFRGELAVRLEDSLGTPAEGRLESVTWRFVRELSPRLELSAPATVFTNASLRAQGEGVLRPEEGQTWAVIEEGSVQADRGHQRELAGMKLPVEWKGGRHEGSLRLDPEIVGVHPGMVELRVRFENQLRDGVKIAGPGEEMLSSRMETTFIANLSPSRASRGQTVAVEGRGFLESGETTGMLLRFEGTFTPNDSSLGVQELRGAAALERTPYAVESDELMRQDVWYEVVGRQLEGLGANPGVFSGSIRPILFDAFGEVHGVAWEGNFEILGTKQIVYLKYLPAFTVALDRYGLLNVEREIRDRILEVAHRDYQGLNIRFMEEPPADFVDYTTVELGGPDPADGYSFGYDNTYNDQPKDTGNLYIDNYLGGINWRAGQEWNNPFGGIFVESFAFFSPTLHPENPYRSEGFDRVFGPFMPELNGQRVRATEWPDGERSEQIAEAIRVFGNVVGNTLSHEVGHVLGLAHFPEDWDRPGHIYHNYEASGCIMDAGADRSFEQRAELDGQGPAVFNERNRAYLEQVLPRP